MSERKEKIKSIAIVFLSIMLVLTFFSNTIMNYSLVEVSTQAVYGGSITTKVRGSGTVQALEGVSIEADLGRKIETINVKTGREVEAGEVLFTLGAGESSALKAAKEAYESAQIAYEKTILQAGITVAERKVIEAGNFGSLCQPGAMADASRRVSDPVPEGNEIGAGGIFRRIRQRGHHSHVHQLFGIPPAGNLESLSVQYDYR